jgi:diacylglycerol kinase (ATP)
MKKIAFIINGKIGGQRKLVEKLNGNFVGDYHLDFLITDSKGAIPLTVKAIENGFTHIISIGGDGSLNEVVNGVMNVKDGVSPEIFSQLRIGVLPYGTGNDFAKTIGASFNLPHLKSWIDKDRFREIDLGLVKFKNLSNKDESRYFVNITDVGLGAHVVKRVNALPKWLGGSVAYQLAIISTLISYRLQAVRASADSSIYTGKVINYIVANGKYFGSGMGIAPDALPDDGMFSIVIVGDVSLAFYLKSISDIKKGKRIEHPQVFYNEAKEVLVESDIPQPIDMDGEYIGNTPMKIKMIPRCVQFICQ